MSLGSPAVASNLTLALRVRAHLATPSMFGDRVESARSGVEEEEEMDAVEDDDAKPTED